MRTTLCAGLLAVFVGIPISAEEAPSPVLRTNINSIWFENWIGLSNAMLRVASPDGKVETIYEKTRPPGYRLSGSPVVDGRYRFELRAATKERVPYDTDLPLLGEEERDHPRTTPVPFYMAGAFQVVNGAVVKPENLPEGE